MNKTHKREDKPLTLVFKERGESYQQALDRFIKFNGSPAKQVIFIGENNVR